MLRWSRVKVVLVGALEAHEVRDEKDGGKEAEQHDAVTGNDRRVLQGLSVGTAHGLRVR